MRPPSTCYCECVRENYGRGGEQTQVLVRSVCVQCTREITLTWNMHPPCRYYCKGVRENYGRGGEQTNARPSQKWYDNNVHVDQALAEAEAMSPAKM